MAEQDPTNSPAPDAQQAHAEPEHVHDAPGHLHDELPEPLGLDFTSSWLDPWVHRHFSPRGTPYVHTFGVEPAFIDRDLFLDAGFSSGTSGEGAEFVAELEWGVTRRLGFLIELPYVWADPSGGQEESGIGDVALAPRALLVEFDRFLASFNLEVSLPTGDDGRGLGGGEISLAPSLSFWLDMGNLVQASVQVGTESGLETGVDELFYGVAGSWTFDGPTPFESGSGAYIEGHFAPGMTSAIVEVLGRRVLDGPNDGTETSEILYGLSYVLTGEWELRGAYRTSISGPGDFDDGIIVSAIFHF